jgi:hypothetical protein
MRKLSLAPITLLTLTTTGLVLGSAGWFSGKTAASSPAEPRTSRQERDALTSEAALRYRDGQPTHWRAFVLHR